MCSFNRASSSIEKCMQRLFALAFAFWMGLLETCATLSGWHGLTWGHWRLVVGLAPGAGWAAGRLWRARLGGVVALLLALPLALCAQVGFSILRNWQLNPLLRLRPGDYSDRRIIRLDIPSIHGPVPALHIVPLSGAQAAVCVAHGSSCDKTFYAWRLVDQMVQMGLAVLLIDLDGHGESPRWQDFPAILHNISAAVMWLRSEYRRVGVIGISLGGCVATRAISEGVQVDALVVLEAPTQLRLTREQINTQIIPLEALRLLRPSVLQLLRDGSVYHVVNAWQTSGLRARISTWDLFDALDLIGSLQRIAVVQPNLPLLLIYAGADAIVVPAEAERVRQAKPAEAEFYLLPRASHISLPIEPRTIELIARWLATPLCCSAPRSDQPGI